MQPTRGNLFADAAAGDGEIFTTLYTSAAIRIESIASRAHASPPGFWYDQAGDEWVVVLRGHAALEFDDGSIVALAKSMNLNVIAEGVETRRHWQFLLESGCREMQGFLVSRAVDVEALEKFVQQLPKPGRPGRIYGVKT